MSESTITRSNGMLSQTMMLWWFSVLASVVTAYLFFGTAQSAGVAFMHDFSVAQLVQPGGWRFVAYMLAAQCALLGALAWLAWILSLHQAFRGCTGRRRVRLAGWTAAMLVATPVVNFLILMIVR